MQYRNYMYDLMRLDFGVSISYFPRTVNDIIADSIIWSIGLMGHCHNACIPARHIRRRTARLVEVARLAQLRIHAVPDILCNPAVHAGVSS